MSEAPGPPDDDGWIPVDGVGEPDEQLEVRDLDAMTEITHPTRGLIMRQLRRPHTVAEVAEALDVPVTRLYHHVNRLTELGVIRVVATRKVAAVTERRYQVTARSFRPHPDLLDSSDPTELARVLGSVFDLAKLGFQRLVEVVGPSALRDDAHVALSLAEVRLTTDRWRELVDRLEAVFKEYTREDAADDDPDVHVYNLFVAAYPEPTADDAS